MLFIINRFDNMKRQSLFEELRSKMGLPSSRAESSEEPSVSLLGKVGNKNASKKSRNIYLGWIHESKTMRMKSGGGSRKVTVQKTCTKSELIAAAEEIFKHGISLKGDPNSFRFDILDFSRCSMPDDISVAEIYEQTQPAGYIRFYLST